MTLFCGCFQALSNFTIPGRGNPTINGLDRKPVCQRLRNNLHKPLRREFGADISVQRCARTIAAGENESLLAPSVQDAAKGAVLADRTILLVRRTTNAVVD